MNTSVLNNALMPFDKMDVSRRLFKYSLSSPVLDIHNFKEFNDQVNFLLKREMQEVNKYNFKLKYEERLIITYRNVISKVLDTIKCDTKTFEFMNKCKECKEEEDFIELLTELGNYLLTRINQKVDSETVIKASLLTDKELGKMGDDPVKYEEDVRNNYQELDLMTFPYEMDGVDNHELRGRSR